jgi:hypothetical protein
MTELEQKIKQLCINEIKEFSYNDDTFTSECDYEIFEGREEFARFILNKIMEETNES